MSKPDLNKVVLNAVRSPRRGQRVLYALGDRPIPAPSGGVIIEGIPYQAGELIPPLVVQVMDGDERKELLIRIEQDRQQRQSRKPAPGQQDLPGISRENEEEESQEVRDQKRRDNARWFHTPGVLPGGDGTEPADRPHHENMYNFFMDHYRDWYENLSDDQNSQAEFSRNVTIGEMNRYLRNDRGAYAHNRSGIEEGIKVFDSLADDAPPLDQDTIVYRGMSNTRPAAFGGKIEKGHEFSNPLFMSTSTNVHDSVEGFTGHDGILMRIVLPKGTRAAAVTAQQIYKRGHSLNQYVNGSGNYENELTLPRDSAFRITSDPHEETFKSKYSDRKIKVVDVEMKPQPSPDEAPQLPHEDIPTFTTNGSRGFDDSYSSSYSDDDDDDSDSDPWDGYDPDDMKSDKESDLEEIIDEYEKNQGHDKDALQELKHLKVTLNNIKHSHYSEPDEFDNAMSLIVDKANEIVANAPDHTDELWAAFDPKAEQRDVLGQLDGVISKFVRTHDISHPVIADHLKQLKLLRDQVAGSLDEDLRENYTYPDEYSDDLSKGLLAAHTLVDLGHALHADQVAGQTPLFLGQTVNHDDWKHWLALKKLFDQHVIKIREFDPELANKVQGLWDKATHGIAPGYDVKTLMNRLETASQKYSNGSSPDSAGYNLPTLSELTRQVDHQVMVHKATQNNISRAKSQGIFQGGDVPEQSLQEWAKKLYQFNKYLSDYRKQQEAAGEPISPQAAQAQIYWDRATKELKPSYETMVLLGRLVDYADAIKGGYSQDYGLVDIKARLNTQLAKEGSPSAKLGARLDQLNDKYREANERFVNSKYYDFKHLGYLDKLKEYVKSKGIEGTKLEHMEKLSPEVQEQVLTHANRLVDRINKASFGQINPSDIWTTPAEETPSVANTALAQLRHKVNQQKILDQFMDAVFKYNKIPEYSNVHHKKLNDLMDQAKNDYPDGTPEQLAAMKEVVRRAEDLANQTSSSVHNLSLPLPVAWPAPPKMLTTHFLDKKGWQDLYTKKTNEFIDAIDEYIKSPEYDSKTHNDFSNSFFMNKSAGAIGAKLDQGTPESNQAILDHFDKVIAETKALAGSSTPSTAIKAPVSTPSHTPSQVMQFVNKSAEFNYEMTKKHDPGLEKEFWMNQGSAKIKADWNKSTPEQKQAILDHMDKVIAQAKTPVVPPAATSTPPGIPSWADQFHKIIQQAQASPTPTPAPILTPELKNQLDEVFGRYLKPKPTEPGPEQKIAAHAKHVHPYLASSPGVSELEAKFPEHMNQIHLDLENYRNLPHYSTKHYDFLVDTLDGIGKHWEDNKNPEHTHEDLQEFKKFTHEAVTDHGTLPHQTIIPAKPIPSPAETNPVTTKPKTLPAPRHTYGRNKVALIDYGRILRRVLYTHADRAVTPAPVDFTPHTHAFGTDDALDLPYFQKMYDFHMGHYGDFLETLSDPEKKMLAFRRPVKISHMGTYLRGRFANVNPEHEKLIQSGIRTMDEIIAKSPPTPHDIILYRGMRKIDPSTVPPGTLIHEPGFPSMSLNAFVSASNFSKTGGQAFRIRIPKGTRLAPVTASQVHDIGYQPHESRFQSMEQELLPGRNHTIKVTGTIEHDPHNNFHYVNAELLPPGPVTKHHRKPWGTTE